MLNACMHIHYRSVHRMHGVHAVQYTMQCYIYIRYSAVYIAMQYSLLQCNAHYFVLDLWLQEKVCFENKASDLVNELQRANNENDHLKLELSQFMKSYDDASSRVRQMEKALEKVIVLHA